MDKAALLEVDKEHFVEELKAALRGPSRTRDTRLQKLAYKYRHLKGCEEEIPCSGVRDGMTFDQFIWEQVG